MCDEEGEIQVDVIEMIYLRSLCGMARMDNVRKEEESRKVDVRENMIDRINQKISKR